MNLLSASLFVVFLVKIPTVNAGVAPKTQAFYVSGDLGISFLIKVGENATQNSNVKTLINSARWTVERINSLQKTSPFALSLSVFQVSAEGDYYDPIFTSFQSKDEHLLLGLVSNARLPGKIQALCDVLEVRSATTAKFWAPLVKLAVQLLLAFNWNDNVTVVAPDEDVLQEFFIHTRRNWMCVRRYLVYEQHTTIMLKNVSGPVVIFSDELHIDLFLKNSNFDETFEGEIVLVPMDGMQVKNPPEGSFVVLPTYYTESVDAVENVTSTPILFEIATPIVRYVSEFVRQSCNESVDKTACLGNERPKWTPSSWNRLQTSDVASFLNIDLSKQRFIYDVFRVEGGARLSKIFSYDVFGDLLWNLEEAEANGSANATLQKEACLRSFEKCVEGCVNIKKGYVGRSFVVPMLTLNVRLRPESWVFSLLALAGLGVLFCVSVFVFLAVRVFKRDTLEGSPVLSIVLLLAVLLMYLSVVPFTLEGKKTARESVCLVRVLSVTSTFAGAFALMLSRSILLATVSKEIGFMSHVAGPVQSFLCLFIFGVQAALNLQVVRHCEEIFQGLSFLYLLSYDVMLLVLLICVSPLVVKSQRNYREGKYFTIASVLIGVSWSCWLPGYAFLDEDWRDPLLCLGLISTASILLGCVFIPRTYLMTLSAARDRITSTLPSLATATSAIDIYRASTQPVYDCVNVAAINAANIARAGAAIPPEQPNFYSCPTLADDDEFDVQRCDTPITSDKVTRF